MNIKNIIDKYRLPQNSVEVSTKSSDLINYKEFVDQSNEGVNLSDRVPVVDEPTWIIECMTGEIYSGNEKGEIIKIPRNRRKVLFMEEGTNGLRTRTVLPIDKDKDAIMRDYKNIKNNMEDQNMKLNDKVNDLGDLSGLDLSSLAVPTEKMDVLAEEVPAAPKETGIKEDSLELAEASTWQVDIGNFNREHGALECLITKNDHKVAFAATKEPSANKGKKAGAGADQGNQANKIQSTTGGTDSIKVLTLRDSKPSPIMGGIVSIPAGGIFDVSSVQSGHYVDANGMHQPVVPDESKTDLKYVMMEKDELYASVLILFDRVIRGAKETFGEAPGGVPYLYEVAVSNRVNSKTGETSQYVRMIPPKKVPLIKPGAYFPLRTFEYLDVKTANEDEINYSAFAHLFKTSTKLKSSPYKNLKAESKQLIDITDEKITLAGVEVNKITSKIFTHQTFVDNGLQCKRWNSKDEFYTDVPVPAKYPKQGKTTISPRYKTYSALDEVEFENSALKNAEFKPLVDRYPAQLNRAALLDVFKSNSRSGKSDAQRSRLATTNSLMFDFAKGKLNSLGGLIRQNTVR